MTEPLRVSLIHNPNPTDYRLSKQEDLLCKECGINVRLSEKGNLLLDYKGKPSSYICNDCLTSFLPTL